jgi:MYXO-CTERM domain-containing protein
VILDATEGAEVTAKRDGDGCAVNVSGGTGGMKPAVVSLDAQCAVTLDPEAAAASAIGTKAPRRVRATSRRTGCCGAEAAPGTSFAMVLVVGLVLRRRRKGCSPGQRSRG